MGLFDKLKEQAQAAVGNADLREQALGAVKDRFGGTSPPAASAAAAAGAAAAAPESTAESVPSPTPATADAATRAEAQAEGAGEGTVTGAGADRTYTTRAGDTLEALAAYFYGDPGHRQRLVDENPDLQDTSAPLGGGRRLRIPEDAS